MWQSDLTKVCRVCLEPAPKMYPVVGPILNVDEHLSTMITYCTSIEITLEDDMPKGVCVPCFRTIRIAYNFIRQFKELNKKLLEERDLKRSEIKCEADDCEDEVQSDSEGDALHNSEAATQDNIKQEDVGEVEEIIVTFIGDNLDNNSDVETKLLENKTATTSDADVPTSNAATQPKHIVKTYRPLQTKTSLKDYVCPICLRAFVTFDSGFVRHLRVHKTAQIKCNKCSTPDIFSTNAFVEHYKTVHLHQCGICEQSFDKRATLVHHVKRHGKAKLFPCRYQGCTKSFLAPSILRKHMHTHSDATNYICSKCGGKFKTYDTFRYHQKTHDGKRSHLCPHCGRTFLQSVHLKYHMWRHTGVKQFQCDDCDKSYTSVTHLKKHRRKYCGAVKEEEVVD